MDAYFPNLKIRFQPISEVEPHATDIRGNISIKAAAAPCDSGKISSCWGPNIGPFPIRIWGSMKITIPDSMAPTTSLVYPCRFILSISSSGCDNGHVSCISPSSFAACDLQFAQLRAEGKYLIQFPLNKYLQDLRPFLYSLFRQVLFFYLLQNHEFYNKLIYNTSIGITIKK